MNSTLQQATIRSMKHFGCYLSFGLCFVLCVWHTPSPSGSTDSQCRWNGMDSLSFLAAIGCPDDFAALGGPPIVPTFGNVVSVKVVYVLANKRMYFTASSRYFLHFDFCKVVLGYPASHELFNTEQYSDGPGRLYYLATINYYKNSGKYSLDFFAEDKIPAEGIEIVFSICRDSCFFGDKIRVLTSSNRIKDLCSTMPDIPVVSEDDLYGSQQFQSLNPGQAYGWLRMVSMDDFDASGLSQHDIVVVNGKPLDIPVIAGIITTEFQTPLSHINVLSHNRGTPNMALLTAWSDRNITELSGKLVHLTVTPDSFALVEASAQAADSFWNAREPKAPISLVCNDDSAGLFDMKDLSFESTLLVGAKAANFAELMKIKVGADSMPVPEAAFAIPFYYYRMHIREAGLDRFIENMLADSVFKSDQLRRNLVLGKLRDSIEAAPLNSAFVALVENKIRSMGSYPATRFRSSTNAEDIKGFNGAGLYESHSGKLDNPDKSIAKAIKKVYASLWTLRGFEEREYFKINQTTAAMGLLVHRSFPNEEANGVAITKNMYFSYVPAFTVNVQAGEVSVVSPPSGVTADQFLFHTLNDDAYENPTIEYIAHSSINEGVPVLATEEIVRLAKWLSAIKLHFYLNVYDLDQDYYSFAMDVEFKFDGADRKLYIKQARPY